MKLNLNLKKVTIISLCVVLFSWLGGSFIIPQVIKAVLRRNVQLRKGSQMRPLFENIPFPLTFKVFIFNITNVDDFANGSKPKVQEIGPYVFEEWKLRENLVDNEDDDTISFTLKQRFIFRPELSNGLSGNEEIFFPNLIIFGTIMTVKREREAFLPTVIKAMHYIFGNSTSPFIRVKAMDVLFHGIEVNCSGKRFEEKAVCTAIRTEGVEQGVRIINETHVSISILGHKNNTDIARFTVLRGIKNIKDLGRIVRVNDENLQSVWAGDECNRYRGTDSTIFPPFLKSHEGLWTFTPDICMSLKANFIKKSTYDGLPTKLYSVYFADLKSDESLHCFCNDPPDDCPLQGTFDLSPCVSSPIYGSKPHFLDADKSLLEKVDGLRPNRSKHDVFVNFEPISGTPLQGAKRLQFSMDIQPIEGYDALSKLPTLLLPIVWVEESVALNRTYTNLLRYQLFLALKANTAFKWIGIICGMIGLIYSGKRFYNEHSKKATVSSSESQQQASNQLNTLHNLIYLSK